MAFIIQLFRNIFKRNKKDTNLMILFLSFSNIVGNGLTLISGILAARWLLPEELGMFNGFTMLTGYIILAQLGIPSGLSRELPLYIGKNDTIKAHEYAAVTQFWQLTLGAGTFSILFFVSLCFFFSQQYDYAAGLFVIGVLSFQVFYVTKYLKILYRTNRDFNKLSQLNLIVAFTSFASIIFIWKFGFYGLCIRSMVMVLVDFYFAWKWRPIQVKPIWDKKAFYELFKVGLPMYGIANLYGLWPVIQRTLILSLGGTRFLGLFALAVIIENSMKTITTAISSVTYPTMVAEWGKGAPVKSLMKLPMKPIALTIALFLFIVPTGWLLLPKIIEIVLPNYLEGVYAAQWMLLVGLVEIFNVFGNIYNVIKKQRDRLIYFVSGILSWLLTIFILYHLFGLTLDIFPKAMFIGILTMLIINFVHIRKYYDLKLSCA